ncbi:hypothetical protein TSAR_006979, partial [Trichomalopsis sarcophagae]
AERVSRCSFSARPRLPLSGFHFAETPDHCAIARHLRTTTCYHVSLSARVLTFVSGFLIHFPSFENQRFSSLDYSFREPYVLPARHGLSRKVKFSGLRKNSGFPGTARHI